MITEEQKQRLIDHYDPTELVEILELDIEELIDLLSPVISRRIKELLEHPEDLL